MSAAGDPWRIALRDAEQGRTDAGEHNPLFDSAHRHAMQLVIRAIRCPPPDRPQTIEARFGANGGRIGRYFACALPLRDPEHFISREHLDIRFRDGRFVLQVISQVNGATVNDVALGPGSTVELSDGDRIRLGRYEFVAELRDETEPAISKPARRDGKMAEDDSQGHAATLPATATAATGAAIPNAQAGTAPEEFILAFAQGLRIDPAVLDAAHPAETARLAGKLLRAAVEGLHRMLKARDETNDPRISEDRPTLVGQDCNPLEHACSADDALRYLVDLRRHASDVFMQPGEAVDAAVSQLVTNPAPAPGVPPDEWHRPD
jgi:predicted component of type VI protein secretion system